MKVDRLFAFLGISLLALGFATMAALSPAGSPIGLTTTTLACLMMAGGAVAAALLGRSRK